MTLSTRRASAEPLDGDWRLAQETVQEAALPAGRAVVSCSAALGEGGLGRHLQEVLEAFARRGVPAHCICAGGEAPPARPGLGTRTLLAGAVVPARRSLAWRVWRAGVAFDAGAARALPPGEHLLAFNGRALRQFRAARAAGYRTLALVAANSHMRQVQRQHARARARYPFEPSWTGRMLARNLAEYERADRIYLASEYIRESFLAQGVAAEKLCSFPLTPARRYRPDPAARAAASTFDVVYVGSLSVAKGVPLLVEAFGRLPQRDLRLVLVGGAGTRGMQRFLQRARHADPRIAICPGDPLPRLRVARLCVHPAYEDGFAYAPAEALACGVPVIVSEDTGMKDLIVPGRDGLVLPTGDGDALAEAIEAGYRGELLDG